MDQIIVRGIGNFELDQTLGRTAHQSGIVDDPGCALDLSDLDHHGADKSNQDHNQYALQGSEKILQFLYLFRDKLGTCHDNAV